jgi:hypothetical protein
MNTRTVVVGGPAELGDLGAPIGSEPWAIAVRVEIQDALKNERFEAGRLQRLLETMRRANGYTALCGPDKQPFASFRDFCVARYPYGLGYEPAALDAIVEERKTAQALAAKAEGEPLKDVGAPTAEETDNVDNININPVGGTSATYLARRIARDRPDILHRMKAGEFRSVRAAAIEAGIVKVPTALDLLRRAWEKATDEERVAFLEHVESEQVAGTAVGR